MGAVQSREMSSRINAAYDVLTNREARLKYDGAFKQAGFPSSAFERTEGLTGPVIERAVPLGVRPWHPSYTNSRLLQSPRKLA